MNLNDSFEIRFPAARVHLGIPTGNSDAGFIIFGEKNKLEICFSLASCWDRRNDQIMEKPCPYDDLVRLFNPYDADPIRKRLQESATEFKIRHDFWWPSTRIPGGRLVLELKEEISRLTLDYSTGMITAHTASDPIRILASLNRNSLLIRDFGGLIVRRRFHPAFEFLKSIYEKAEIPAAEYFEDGCFQPLPDDPGTLAWFSGSQLNLALSRDAVIPSAAALEFDLVLEENRNFWSNYWETVPVLELPDELLNRFFRLALYKFALATLPGGVPCGLQGCWLEDYQRAPWSADYHFNVNVQQVYTLAPSIGAVSHMMPLFDMLESSGFQDSMKKNAKSLFGIDDGLLLTHAVTDQGRQCGGVGTGAVLDFVCGGWTALLYWMYYRHTEDATFLRNRALPFMRGVMNVFKAALREKDGALELPLSISAEYGCTFPVTVNGKECRQNTGKNPSNQLTCCHLLANALMEAERITGQTPDPFLERIKRELPHFSVVNDRVAIWEGQDLDVCHRHNSHLSMIYPFDITGELNADERKAVDNAVEHWIWRGSGQWSEWSYPWAAILQARWGMSESPSVLLDVWKRLFLNESLATVYLPRFRGISSHRHQDMLKPKESSEVMQLDGTMAGATALLEMIVHEKNGVVTLFPALPETWKNLTFKRIRLPGVCVSGSVRNGNHAEVVFESGKTRTIHYRPAWEKEIIPLELTENVPCRITCTLKQ